MADEQLFRWTFLAALLLNLGISGYYRRKARQAGGVIARRAEGGTMLAVRLLFTVPLLLTIAAYLIHPASMAWARVPLPEPVRWAAGALAVGIAPFNAWILRTLGRNVSETVLVKASHALVTDGPYRWVRHPLYTAGLLLIAALSVLAANWFMALLAGIGVVFITRVIIPREEAVLLDTFGEAYRAYRRRTGRLLPALHRT